jgi:hypothetical protein
MKKFMTVTVKLLSDSLSLLATICVLAVFLHVAEVIYPEAGMIRKAVIMSLQTQEEREAAPHLEAKLAAAVVALKEAGASLTLASNTIQSCNMALLKANETIMAKALSMSRNAWDGTRGAFSSAAERVRGWFGY